jgi:hypothetical protein
MALIVIKSTSVCNSSFHPVPPKGRIVKKTAKTKSISLGQATSGKLWLFTVLSIRHKGVQRLIQRCIFPKRCVVAKWGVQRVLLLENGGKLSTSVSKIGLRGVQKLMQRRVFPKLWIKNGSFRRENPGKMIDFYLEKILGSEVYKKFYNHAYIVEENGKYKFSS